MYTSMLNRVDSVKNNKVICEMLVVKTEPKEYDLRYFMEHKVSEIRIFEGNDGIFLDVYIPDSDSPQNNVNAFSVKFDGDITNDNKDFLIEYILNNPHLIQK